MSILNASKRVVKGVVKTYCIVVGAVVTGFFTWAIIEDKIDEMKREANARRDSNDQDQQGSSKVNEDYEEDDIDDWNDRDEDLDKRGEETPREGEKGSADEFGSDKGDAEDGTKADEEKFDAGPEE